MPASRIDIFSFGRTKFIYPRMWIRTWCICPQCSLVNHRGATRLVVDSDKPERYGMVGGAGLQDFSNKSRDGLSIKLLLRLDRIDPRSSSILFPDTAPAHTVFRYSTPAGDPLVHLAQRPVFMPNYPGWGFFKFNPWRAKAGTFTFLFV